MANYEQKSLGFTYDVFISFRGEDIRRTFIGHLRKELSCRGIRTFFDDWDMRMGQDISISLPDAIDESKILIVAFTENYASSTWCLDELVKILKCGRRNNQLVFPIFYHVDPSHVRKQTGCYADHMKAHEVKFGKDSKKVKDWRSALFKASNLPGQHIVTGSNKDEIDLIQEIVEKIYKNIDPKPLHDGQNPVGIEPRIKEVMSLLDMKSDDVLMLGIYGLGGIGKTELAKALHDKIVQRFDAACFLENVTEKSIEDLQSTLLSELLEKLQNELGSTSRGMSEIKRRFRQKKVLLVLDDVDDKDKLEKLAGERDWFGKGSRIIITTRDKDVLIAHKVEEMYEMKELDEQHSLELFCLNAFNQSEPKAGFEKVSLRVAGFAKRLPLALKVIGSDFASEETLDDWESVIKEYYDDGNRLNERIHNVLKISYDRLGRNPEWNCKPKQVFLDIACFFKGQKKEYVENILGAEHSITQLCKKSLLTIEGGFLKMHDLIQDMGRQIVEEEAENPGKRSRLWYHRDVIRVLTEDLGSNKIQGIMLDPPKQRKLDLNGSAFEKMKCLRILIVRNTSFLREPERLPNYLRVLDWEEYPSKSFPSMFYPEDIVIFNLSGSHLTLQEPFKKYSCLIHMDLSHSLSITQIPDVSELQNLRELRLDHCRNLTAVHQTVGFLTRLTHLRVSGCTKLKIFLRKMFLPSLLVLDLNFCASLEHFPEITEEMKKPLKIYMIFTAIKDLPESIGNLTGLISIDMSYSRKLEYLPSRFFMLPNVVNFKSKGCSQLRVSFGSVLQSLSAVNFRPEFRRLNCEKNGLSDEDLSVIFSCFPKLEELIASNNNFVSLPAFNKECVHLTSFDVSFCQALKKIHEIKCTKLRILNVAGCENLEKISELPSTIQKVDARYCYSLTEETSDMLWRQAAKEIEGLEVVMPKKDIQDWFDGYYDGGNPHFLCRGKFPNFALALVFDHVNGLPSTEQFSQLVELNLFINRRFVPRKGYHCFRVADGHVLICDMRLVFSDKEQLDALFVEQEWNLVQVSCEDLSFLKLSCWGVYVYRDGTNYNLDDVQFTCPHQLFLDISSPKLDPPEVPRSKPKKKIEKLHLDGMFDTVMVAVKWFEYFPEKEEVLYPGVAVLKQLSMEAKDELECEDSVLENKNSFLTSLLDEVNFDLPLPESGLIYNQLLNENTSEKDFEELIKQATNILREPLCEGKMKGLVATDKHSFPNSADTDEATLKWFADSIDNEQEAELENFFHKEVGEASSSKGQDYDPQQHKLMKRKMFYEGVTDAIVEAKNVFPSLDIIQTRIVALNSGKCVVLKQLENIIHPSWAVLGDYIIGVCSGLLQASFSCRGLDVGEIFEECIHKKLAIVLLNRNVCENQTLLQKLKKKCVEMSIFVGIGCVVFFVTVKHPIFHL